MDTLQTDGYYVGKLLKWEGVKKDKEGNNILDQDGKNIISQMFSYQFKRTMDTPTAFSFSSFDTDAETNYGLLIGQKYIIDYIEKPNVKFPDSPHKNLVSAVKGELQQRGGTVSAPLPTIPTTNPAPQLFDEFAAIYTQQIEGNPNKSPAHMMATYLVSYEFDKYKALFTRCCEKLGVEPPK